MEGLPFMQSKAVGAGLFQRQSRWRANGRHSNIISDDTFVRLQFAPGDRN
jgi:hypothetical protein